MKNVLNPAIFSNLKKVASNSFVENIKMIAIEKLIPNAENFYDVSKVELLASDIERQGLKHNLVVMDNSDDTYTVISGHRRLSAVQFLNAENRAEIGFLPCFVMTNEDIQEQKIDLVMLNATTRFLSDGELLKQYEIVKEAVENIKANGIKIKGKIRDNIAEMLKVSPAQVGKIENIKKNAIPSVITAINEGEISLSAANEIAKLDTSEQLEAVRNKEKSSEIKKKQKKTKTSDYDEELENCDTNITFGKDSEPISKAKVIQLMAEFIEKNGFFYDFEKYIYESTQCNFKELIGLQKTIKEIREKLYD